MRAPVSRLPAALAALCAQLALAQPAAAERPSSALTPQAAPASPAVVDEHPRRPVELRAAMKLAAEKNTDLKSVRATVDQVKAQAGQVWGAVLPEISANGSLVYTTAPAPFDLGGIVGLTGAAYRLGDPLDPSVIPKPVNIVADKSAYATVQVTQILFTPSMLLLPAAWSAPEAARLGLMEAREQILLAVARVYLGLEGIREIEAAARDAEAVALKRERDARAQLAAGTAVEVAVLRAQAETAQARRTQAELSASRLSLLGALEVLTGEAVAPAEGAPPLPTPQAQDEAKSPWEQTWGVKSAAKAVETVETQVNFDQFQWAPTLLAQVKGSYNSNSGFSGRNFSADFILALSFPIFDRGVRYAKLHEDEARLMDAQAKLTGGRLKAKAAWQSAKANLASAEAVLQEAQAQASLTVRAQKQVEGAVRAGFSTALEQSDIDNKAFFARSSAAQARVQVEVRKVELVVAEGRLATLLELPEEP